MCRFVNGLGSQTGGAGLLDGSSDSRDRAAYHLREDLTDLFDRDYTKAGPSVAIRAWCKRVVERVWRVERFLGRIERWMQEISNYYDGSVWRASTTRERASTVGFK